MESQTESSVFQISGNPAPDYKTLYQETQSRQHFLLSQISHEIRNPVTLINSFLQLFESHHPEIVQDECWEKVMENMSFLRALLEEFSSFNNSSKLSVQEISLDNLVRDTIESVTPTQGLIICSLSCDGENVYLTVKDTGSGIPANYQKDIFEPFVTHKEGGTGLGLAICQRIVSAHGGRISFLAPAGKETSFIVVLPIT